MNIPSLIHQNVYIYIYIYIYKQYFDVNNEGIPNNILGGKEKSVNM